MENVDLSVTVMGQKLALPSYRLPPCSACSITRRTRGRRSGGQYGTMFGVSSLGTVSLEELRKTHDTPQVYQFYFHRYRGLNRAMLQRAKDAALTS